MAYYPVSLKELNALEQYYRDQIPAPSTRRVSAFPTAIDWNYTPPVNPTPKPSFDIDAILDSLFRRIEADQAIHRSSLEAELRLHLNQPKV